MKSKNCSFFLTVFLSLAPSCLPRLVRVGALFTEDQKVGQVTDISGNLILNNFPTIQDSPSELAFKYAVYKINKDPHILQNKTLTYDIQYVPREDSFRTTNKVHI